MLPWLGQAPELDRRGIELESASKSFWKSQGCYLTVSRVVTEDLRAETTKGPFTSAGWGFLGKEMGINWALS